MSLDIDKHLVKSRIDLSAQLFVCIEGTESQIVKKKERRRASKKFGKGNHQKKKQVQILAYGHVAN